MLASIILAVEASALIKSSGAIGAAIVALAAALGIGGIGKALMENSARQPEISGGLRTSALIVAALIEGVCLFAVIVCLINVF